MTEDTADDAARRAAASVGAPAADGAGIDLGRRAFFRSLSREALNAAARVAGTAMAVRQATGQVTGELLGLGIRTPEASAAILGRRLASGEPAIGADGRFLPQEAGAVVARSRADVAAAMRRQAVRGAPFRGPYRVEGEALVLVDQRRLPEQAVEVVCRSGADVTAAVRRHAVRGAPVLAQVAAYGLWLAALEARAAPPSVRGATIRGTGDALRLAAEGAAPLRWAIDRVVARWYAAGEFSSGDTVAAAIRAEADAIAGEAALDHGRLVRHGTELLPPPDGHPLTLLTLDETGALGGGLMGTALGVVKMLAAEGREVAVRALDTWPDGTGRLTAWELGLDDIPCAVVPDAAAGALLASGGIDAVLVGAERVAADGSLANPAGTYGLAVLAARHGVPFYVCTPTAALDQRRADAAALQPALRRLGAATLKPPADGAADETLLELAVQDVTPAELITAYVTEEGVARPPFAVSLAAHRAAADARHPAPPPHPTAGRPADADRSGAG